jgi:hypothetical protein
MKLRAVFVFLFVWLLAAASTPAQEKVDLGAISRIKAEAFDNSKVMDHLFYLTDVHAPRISNSPGYRAGAEWTIGRLKEYGPRTSQGDGCLRPWLELSALLGAWIEPQYAPLIGFPLAWTPGTNGPVIGEPVIAVLRSDADLEKFKGKLKGKIVLTDAPRQVPLPIQPDARRYSDIDLAQLFAAPEPGVRQDRRPPTPASPFVTREEQAAFRRRLTDFARNEPAGHHHRRIPGNNGTVPPRPGFARSERFAAASGHRACPGHYNPSIAWSRRKFRSSWSSKSRPDRRVVAGLLNIVADIPHGKKDELVIPATLRHLARRHRRHGNSSGVSVAMEAARIFKTLKPLSRTVRLAGRRGSCSSLAHAEGALRRPHDAGIEAEHAARRLLQLRQRRQDPRHLPSEQ